MFTEGQHVKVVANHEASANNEASAWVGATGTIAGFRDGTYVVNIATGNPNPQDSSQAWFDESELVAV